MTVGRSFGMSTPNKRGILFSSLGSHDYPWRCLWRGLLHTTYTTPRRRTTLHLSQIRLTLALTFIAAPRTGPLAAEAQKGRRAGNGGKRLSIRPLGLLLQGLMKEFLKPSGPLGPLE